MGNPLGSWQHTHTSIRAENKLAAKLKSFSDIKEKTTFRVHLCRGSLTGNTGHHQAEITPPREASHWQAPSQKDQSSTNA